jgi:hypothetical protein
LETTSVLTYCGLLDDFALRNRDVGITSIGELNEYLVVAVLFGGPLLVNDGHVITHGAVQQAVQAPHLSPFRQLVETGFVKILTRNERRLESLADEMADVGITSFQRLRQQISYQHNFLPALQQWSERLRSSAFNAFEGWPDIQVDDVFRSVAGAAYSSLHSAEPEWHQELERFHDQLTTTKWRRTEWENVANQLRASDKIGQLVRQALMFTANEAYQYAWGCALGATDADIRVLTRAPRHLSEFDVSLGQITAAARHPLRVLVPDPGFASQAVNNRWELLANVVTSGELRYLKQTFLDTLANHHVSDSVSRKEVEDVADAYAEALSVHFGAARVRPAVFELMSLGLATIGTVVGGVVASPAVGLALGLTGFGSAHLGGPQAFWRFAPANRKRMRILVGAAADTTTSSFRLKGSQIKEHTRHAASFR